ncbi:hypothetical protein BDF20DRAFT_992119 [Mycotypha africana]|uniref:uncharacterized protein n=1 Tax=Mycotypha africana TaxID=64632 RepID=UPI002301FDD0|nr:uncharacterized protein BDF20DRAFT_992119 [Mycotypha africana]KAI8967308.1 hypothetical protein BDF20DRAFT_992119 [Mycotypha africana]
MLEKLKRSPTLLYAIVLKLGDTQIVAWRRAICLPKKIRQQARRNQDSHLFFLCMHEIIGSTFSFCSINVDYTFALHFPPFILQPLNSIYPYLFSPTIIMDGETIYVVTILYAKGEEEVDDHSMKTKAFSNLDDANWYRGVVSKKVYQLYKYQGQYSLSEDLTVSDDNDNDWDEAEIEENVPNRYDSKSDKWVNNPEFILVDHKRECTYIVADTRDRNSLYTIISVRKVIIGES